MSRSRGRDPYDGFTCDEERRKALATRERAQAARWIVTSIVAAISGMAPASLDAVVRLLGHH